jgi:hypothetical protein
MTKGIIDRFEGDYAIIEIDGNMKQVKVTDLPADAREGDSLVFIEAENQWQIDRKATAQLKDEIRELADEVWE